MNFKKFLALPSIFFLSRPVSDPDFSSPLFQITISKLLEPPFTDLILSMDCSQLLTTFHRMSGGSGQERSGAEEWVNSSRFSLQNPTHCPDFS